MINFTYDNNNNKKKENINGEFSRKIFSIKNLNVNINSSNYMEIYGAD